MVMRCSIVSAWIAEPRYSNTYPVPPATPICAISARIISLEDTPWLRTPSTRTSQVLGRFCSRHWLARTCSTSEVPMPNARAPKAPCVDVWLSPHTMVMPGWVSPSSGPITCTMPRFLLCVPYSEMPNSRALSSICWICLAACRSRIGREGSRVGTLWSIVATVLAGWRTFRPRCLKPVKACGLVTSWTRCRSIYKTAGLPGFCATTCASHTFSNKVFFIALLPRLATRPGIAPF